MALRQLPRLLAPAAYAALLLQAPAASAPEEAGWQQAVDRLAHEKILAEGCVSLLKTFADRDPMARVQGQRLYARAKADVDGLITLLELDLAGDRSPAAVPELRYRLEAVPTQRQALCRQVDAAVATAVREQRGRAGAVDLLIKGARDAATPLIDAAVQIWKAYRHAGPADRKSIDRAMELTRWRDYAQIPHA